MAKCDTCKANKVCDHDRFGFENCGSYIAADVVPRAEVEYWKEQCFNACMGNGCLDHKVVIEAFNAVEGHDDPVGEEGECCKSIKCESVKNAKAEVAKEIFEILEDECLAYPIQDGHPTILVDAREYAELKKKYTEGEK